MRVAFGFLGVWRGWSVLKSNDSSPKSVVDYCIATSVLLAVHVRPATYSCRIVFGKGLPLPICHPSALFFECSSLIRMVSTRMTSSAASAKSIKTKVKCVVPASSAVSTVGAQGSSFRITNLTCTRPPISGTPTIVFGATTRRLTPVTCSSIFLGIAGTMALSSMEPPCARGFMVCVLSGLGLGFGMGRVGLGWIGVMVNSGTGDHFVRQLQTLRVPRRKCIHASPSSDSG